MYQGSFPFGRNELAALGHELGFAWHVSQNPMPSVWHPIATIRGVVDGVAVAVQRFAHKRGYSDRACAAIWPPLDLGLSLRLEGSVTRAVKSLFGSQDVLTGDAPFDAPLRIQADEPDRVRSLLDAELRHKLHWFAGSCEEFELGDEGVRTFSSGFLAPRNWRVDLPALVDVVRGLRASSANVRPAAALAPWADALRSHASAYGLAFRTCPLSADGDLDNLRCGIFFRRLDKGRYAVELGAVIAPLDPFQVTMLPRKPRLRVEPFELAKPTQESEEVPPLVDWDDPRVAKRFVVEAVHPRYPDVRAVIPREVQAKMLELQETFDVDIRHGVLSIRREITGDDPANLAKYVDLAADGARVVVRQSARGYR
jgi:hypothetical protein